MCDETEQTIEINSALEIFFGSEPDSTGIKLSGRNTRIEESYGDSAPTVKKLINRYLSRAVEFPYDAETSNLTQGVDDAADWIAIEMPELSEITVDNLAIYWQCVMSNVVRKHKG